MGSSNLNDSDTAIIARRSDQIVRSNAPRCPRYVIYHRGINLDFKHLVKLIACVF